MKKGFTLIELIVASSIFIIVMMIATAIFAWASTYNGKLREMRNISQSIRSATDMISKDIRMANGKAGVLLGTPNSFDITEISLYDCKNISFAGNCSLKNNSNITPLPADFEATRLDTGHPTEWIGDSNSNLLMIIQKDRGKYILYRSIKFSEGNFDLLRFEGNISPLGSVILPTVAHPYVLNSPTDVLPPDRDKLGSGWVRINDHDISLKTGFAGYAVNRNLNKIHQYCEFGMRGQSIDYEKINLSDRSRLDMRTTVETRDYNYSF